MSPPCAGKQTNKEGNKKQTEGQKEKSSAYAGSPWRASSTSTPSCWLSPSPSSALAGSSYGSLWHSLMNGQGQATLYLPKQGQHM